MQNLGRGYYSINKLRARRKVKQAELRRLDDLILQVQQLRVERRQQRMSRYNDRNAQIVAMRHRGMTLDAIGEEFGITKNRVCQIAKGNGS
jgi:DNA-directed RNA polymerase specialized sigma subunit